MEKKKTLVIGASENRERYSNLAVQKLTAHQHPVIALGIKTGKIGNTVIETEKNPWRILTLLRCTLTRSGKKLTTIMAFATSKKNYF